MDLKLSPNLRLQSRNQTLWFSHNQCIISHFLCHKMTIGDTTNFFLAVLVCSSVLFSCFVSPSPKIGIYSRFELRVASMTRYKESFAANIRRNSNSKISVTCKKSSLIQCWQNCYYCKNAAKNLDIISKTKRIPFDIWQTKKTMKNLSKFFSWLAQFELIWTFSAFGHIWAKIFLWNWAWIEP